MKKQLIIKFVKGIMLFVSTLLFTGCIQRTLDQLPLDMPVNISFDWTNLAAGSKKPSSMMICFYNSDGTFYSKEKCSADGFSGALPEGVYKVLVFTEDDERVEVKSFETYDQAQIRAKTVTKSTRSDVAVDVIYQPGNVYGIGLDNLVVSNTVTTKALTPMAPKALVKQVTLNIGVTGDKNAISNCATTLSGVSRAVSISTGLAMPVEANVAFEPTSSNTDNKAFQSTLSIFGVIPTIPNVMATVVTYTNGHKETLPLADLSKALTEALAPAGAGAAKPVDVKVEIAVTEAFAGVFTAKVTSWKIVNKDLIVE